MENTKHYLDYETNKKTNQQSKLLNGLLGHESITYGDLNIALDEFRPHYTNCKYNKEFSSSFNQKFIKRYEFLSFLRKSARYNSKLNNRLSLFNIALVILIVVAEKFSLLPSLLLNSYNAAVFALIGYFIYKSIIVKLSIKTLNRENVKATGSVSLYYLGSSILSLALVLVITKLSILTSFHIYTLIPLFVAVFALAFATYHIKSNIPVITTAERKVEKQNAQQRYMKSINQTAKSDFIKATLMRLSPNKIIYIDDYKRLNQEALKYLNRRKARL